MEANIGPGYYSSDELRALGVACGEHTVVAKNCTLIGQISLGHHVRIDGYSTLTGRITLGNYIHIGVGCFLSGRAGIDLEDFSGLSPGVHIFTRTDDFSGEHLLGPTVPEQYTDIRSAPVHLRRCASVGTGCVILPGVELGEGSVLCALSLARRSILPSQIHGGWPAGFIGVRSTKLLDLADALTAESQEK